MKKKTPKFHLSKETVRSLNAVHLEQANGGASLACTTDLFNSVGCSPYPSWDPCGAGNTSFRCV